MGDVSVIKDLLKDYPKLICERVFRRDIKEIKNILRMEEWKEEKFQNLLTSTIWISNYKDIIKKFHL